MARRRRNIKKIAVTPPPPSLADLSPEEQAYLFFVQEETDRFQAHNFALETGFFRMLFASMLYGRPLFYQQRPRPPLPATLERRDSGLGI
ncbi:hypothetical protein HK104_008086 [Borealophlyctis nickersoniae]|nr:hypothetical protein HK104_008086 [Borealophlyctis nickersoniae]